MRVLFDGHWWVDNGPISGRVVVRDLVTAWARRFSDDEVVLAVPRRSVADVEATMPDNVRCVATHLQPHAVVAAVESVRLLRKHGPFDVVLTQNFTPVVGPAVPFIHDVLFQTNPEWFTRVERAYFAGIPILARRAPVVLTSSQNEADRIQRLNPRIKQVTAIGLGVPTGLTSVTPQAPAGVEGLASFLLSVGRLNVRKNLGAAIEAAIASGELSADRPMLVVGEPAGRTDEKSAAMTDAEARGLVRFLGGVSDAELAWLYGHAALFVYVSLDEGFGLPPHEALHFGCRVLVSDLPVFRESLGDAATYADPRDTADVASKVAVALGTPAPTDVPTSSWEQVVEKARAAVLQHLDVAAAQRPAS
jgi:glycosyltransferase involved in cell wall biosynthesis